MTKDLYETLGIDRAASKEDVRRAYRRKAKSAHPDTPGGSATKFHDVQKAHRILTDARARDTYDRTGQAEDPEPDQREAKAIQTAFMMVCEVLLTIDQRGGHPGDYDILADAKRKITTKIAELKTNLANNKREAAKAHKMAKSFKGKKNKPSRLEAMFRSRAIDIERSYAVIEADIALMERTIEILKDETFSYQGDEAPPMRGGPMFVVSFQT